MSADWPVVRLGDFCIKVGSGSTPNGGANVYLEQGEIRLIRSQNVHNDGFKSNGLVYITQESADKLKNVVVEENDILLNITGDSVARVCLAKNEYLPARVNQHVAIIRPDPEKFDSRYLRYLLVSPTMQNLLLSIASIGATRNALTKGMIESLEVCKPPISIQKSIANSLEALDLKRELNTQTNQTLEAIAQEIFKSWFVDFEPVKAKMAVLEAGGTAEEAERAAMCAISGKDEAALTQLQTEQSDAYAELAQTAALFPAAMQDSELGEIPEGWEITRFKNIVSKYIDNRGKTPPTTNCGIPLLEVKYLPEGSLRPNLDTDKFIDEDTYNSWFRAHIEKDDIIMSTVGTIGRVCIVPAGKRVTIAQNLLGLRFDRKKAAPYFMYYQMNGFRFRHDVDARLVITVQASIKRKDLETIDLLLPSLAIQSSFERIISPFVKTQQSDEVLCLSKLRDTLLPKLLSGEIDLSQAADMGDEVSV
jgi:type I restriction enzyme S subunit